MTKEKWFDIVTEEAAVYSTAWYKIATHGHGPETWDQQKVLFLNYIKAIDKATEVYNMENKGRENG